MHSQIVDTNKTRVKIAAVSRWVIQSCLILLLGVSAALPITPASKIDPTLMQALSGGKVAHFLVLFNQDVLSANTSTDESGSTLAAVQLVDRLQQSTRRLQDPVRRFLDSKQVSYRSYWIVNMLALEGDLRLIEQLADFPQVQLIEPDQAIEIDLGAYIDDPGRASGVGAPGVIQANLVQVHAPEVWARGKNGAGAVIAIADTGVLWTHAALVDQYRGWDGTVSAHDYNWWDAIHKPISGTTNRCGYNLSFPCDDYGHGTHVTGTAAGDDGAGYQIGMAPGARWIACRNMDNGIGRPSTYIECLQFFMAPTDLEGNNPRPDLRPDVINNSYSCPASELCESHSLEVAVENVRAAGIFMAVSAGNSGPGCATINTPPALEASVFTIGAVNSSNTIASFSSRGPVTIDGTPLMKPDLVAPGVSILSSLSTGGYGAMSGTSMAAPHISGAVAILWGAYPALRRNVDFTESLLETTALPLMTDQGCGGDLSTQSPNNVYGWGLLNVKAAYDFFWPLQPKQLLLPIYKD